MISTQTALFVASICALTFLVVLIILLAVLYKLYRRSKCAAPGPFKRSDDLFPITEEQKEELKKAFREARGIKIDTVGAALGRDVDNPYRLSKCCGASTRIPEKGNARCPKCNKFTKLI